MVVFKLIAAWCNPNRGLAAGGKLPWADTNEGKADMLFFSSTTTAAPPAKRNAVIMGRKTYEAIGRTLPNRLNIVISTTLSATATADLITVGSVVAAVKAVCEQKDVATAFVIGGETIYRQFLKAGIVSICLITHINGMYECDTHFTSPLLPFEWECIPRHDHFMKIVRATGRFGELAMNRGKPVGLRLAEYTNACSDEIALLAVMSRVAATGFSISDRTGVGARVCVGEKLEYSLEGGRFPIMTTRKGFFKGIVAEVLWMLRGQTDAKILQRDGIHIWDGNSSRQFLDDRNLTNLEEGDIGAGYGFQMRHFGDTYYGAAHAHTGGADQLRGLLDGILRDPDSRRHIISLWNPMALDQTALPPCHVLYQWIVNTATREISCCFYQRSSDLFLAGNWNACGAALMTYIIGHITGYTPLKVVMMIGNAHVYSNHAEQVAEQCRRKPLPPPLLEVSAAMPPIQHHSTTDIDARIKQGLDWIDGCAAHDFRLINYQSSAAIKGTMN
jgi:dihydrofolate reductase/thymidylate synthase